MASHVYSTIEVAQATGFSVRQLDYWALHGIVVPSIQKAKGPGTSKLYSLDDLVQLQFIRQLKRYGWSTQKIGKAVNTLRDVMNDPNPLKHAVLIHGKNTLFALCKTQEGERIALDALSVGGQQVMSVVIEMLVGEAQQIAHSIDGSAIRDEEVIR